MFSVLIKWFKFKYLLFPVFFLLIPDVLEGNWFEVDMIGGMLGSNSTYSVDLCDLTVGVGGNRSWVPGIGVGLSVVSWTGFRDIEVADTSVNIVPSIHSKIVLPLSSKKSSRGQYFPASFYVFAKGTGWKEKFFMYGGGLRINSGLFFGGVEAGYYQSFKDYVDFDREKTPYIGINCGFGVLGASTPEKLESPKNYLGSVYKKDIVFGLWPEGFYYEPGEKIKLLVKVVNLSSNSSPRGLVLWEGSLSKYLEEKNFVIPSIRGMKGDEFEVVLRLNKNIPKGYYNLKVKGARYVREADFYIQGFESSVSKKEKKKTDYKHRKESFLKTTDFNPKWPTKIHLISSDYGWRKIKWEKEFHRGIDIPVPVGTVIRAAANGKVTFSGWKGHGYGNAIWIKHSNNYETLYAHLRKCSVRNGDWVNEGDIIGYSGKTGRSFGPHLHFGIMKKGEFVDPELYLP